MDSDMSEDKCQDGQRIPSTSRMAVSSALPNTEKIHGNVEDTKEDVAALQRGAKLISRLHAASTNPLSTEERRESADLLKDILDRYVQFPKRLEKSKTVGSELREKIASLERENNELQEKVAFAEETWKLPTASKEDLAVKVQYFEGELKKEMERRISAEIGLASLIAGTANNSQSNTEQQQPASHLVYEGPEDDHDFSIIAQLSSTQPLTSQQSTPPLDAIIEDDEASVPLRENNNASMVLREHDDVSVLLLVDQIRDGALSTVNRNETAPRSRPSSSTLEARKNCTNSTTKPVSNFKATGPRRSSRLSKSVSGGKPGRSPNKN